MWLSHVPLCLGLESCSLLLGLDLLYSLAYILFFKISRRRSMCSEINGYLYESICLASVKLFETRFFYI